MEKVKVVLSIAGRDKGRLLAVVGEEDSYYLLVDGKERPISRPKRKNVRHIAFTACCLEQVDILSNKSLRRALMRCKEQKEDFGSCPKKM